MDNVRAYDARADTINVDEITSESSNRIILRHLQRNNADERHKIVFIRNDHDEDEDEEGRIDYCPEGAGDMGWLGYFIGQNEFLEELHIDSFAPTSGSSVRDVMEPFFRGVSSNKSIRKIEFYEIDLLGGDLFTILGPFFKNNLNLTGIYISRCDFGEEVNHLFALAIGSCTNKSLKNVDLQNNNISEEGMVDIITSLSMHPNLNYLGLDGNLLRKNGCVALATLLQCSAKVLQHVFISNTGTNDEGIEVLIPALATCIHLKWLCLSDNPSITTNGWQSLATVLESPISNLEGLDIAQNNADDEAASAFANALSNNGTLSSLNMSSNPITAVGWEALSKLLCNTSSVNSTFLSNHTLWYMDNDVSENEIVRPLLRLNERRNKKEVATIKIIQTHADFDMMPFFEWEFKVLPLVISWLERASAYEMPEDFEPNIQSRKLSTIYQFVRGLPLLYVETRLRKELEDIKAEESQMEDRKQMLRERKASILKRLARQ